MALAKELKIDADNLLGWNVYPDRVVLISMNGMKFSSALKDGRSSKITQPREVINGSKS